MGLDYGRAAAILGERFELAVEQLSDGRIPNASSSWKQAVEELFESKTQSFREVLLGSALVRLVVPEADLRKPYVNQGEGAYNGRTMDERVVNPFLQTQRIPSSKGPYLAVFRRSVLLQPGQSGIRDQRGYEALMRSIDELEEADEEGCLECLTYLLYRFAQFREASTIRLARVGRLSLEQLDTFNGALLSSSSGGLIPVLLTVAVLKTIQASFDLAWRVEHQGINVADRASGAGADISVYSGEACVLSIEVTERCVDENRVVSTFNTKIVEAGIVDYIFAYGAEPPSDGAREAARRYFAQGHEIIFVELRGWIRNCLVVLGTRGRTTFLNEARLLFESEHANAAVKVLWNAATKTVIA
jgi:hypothetical protein